MVIGLKALTDFESISMAQVAGVRGAALLGPSISTTILASRGKSGEVTMNYTPAII